MSGLIVAGQQAAADRATSDDAVTALQQATAVISAVCDYAQELDGQGFNAADAWLGHILAQMPPGVWSDPAALTAWDMLRKYRDQLAAARIDYDQLPRPAAAGELEAGRREQAREHARQHARTWREQQYRHTHSYVRCDGEGEQVTLAFPYDPELVARCRTIEGRRYDGAAKTNVFPFTSLPAVIELAARHGIEVTADVRALAPIAAGRAAGRAAGPQVRLDEHDGTIVIDASLDASVCEQVRDLGGRWDRAARVHRVPGHHAPALASLAGRHGLRIRDQVRQFAADTAARQENNRSTAGAFEADPVPVPGVAPGLALKPQQYPVVRFALAHRRVLIGDDMGWGKTLSSLAVVAADGAYPAVVVCRPSLTLNWAAEIMRFFPGLVVQEARGTSPQPLLAGADVIIVGSAALAAKPRKTTDGGKQFGWVEELARAGPKALIIDEGQDTKERGANRSQACEQLAATVIARDGLVLDLTGTAILNRPRELCQQLTILGRIAEFGGPKAFLWRYCLSETNQWGASYDGARNLIELHDRLRAWGIMIRRCDDAALGLPPCREHVLRIPAADLDPAVMDRYRRAEADLLGFLAGQARQAAARFGQDPGSAAVEAAMRASAAEHLVAINTLRQLAGQAKRGYVTGWVRDRVAAGEKVMVAAHHRDQVDAYAAAFGGLKLQGGQPVAEKEAVKARFQQQPAGQAPVIAVAIGAGESGTP
jgi:SNF2-related domain